ncbi:MAG TPA: hypothetical protein VK914_02415 [bacterium]|jgi:outer membrane protein OmpA-like peptidoglycan-associated protein|nr:hypothetical protein [bacterium]
MKTRLPLAAALLALALLGSGCKKPVTAVVVQTVVPTVKPTPINDTVAFTRSGALWVAHSDGTGAHLLAAPGEDEDFWFPVVSPNGDGFLVWLSRGDGTQDIARIGLTGRVSVLTDTGEKAEPPMKKLDLDNAPSCSPDGKQIAYSFNGNLWIMDADGNNAQTLISDGSSWAPAWSPDGKQIAYVNGPDGHFDLWVTSVENHDTSQLTDFNDYSVGSPRWSPDGGRIMLTRTRGEDSDIVELSSGGDAPTSDADMLTKDHLSASAVFSPSGAQILYSSAQADTVTWDLYVGDAQGNSSKRITHGGGLSPAWTSLPLGSGPVAAPAPLPTQVPTPMPTAVPTALPTSVATAAPTAAPAQPAAQAPAAAPTKAPAAAQAAPMAKAAVSRPALRAASLRMRFRASFDDQDQLDAQSLAALRKLAKRVRQYPGDSLDVVGPLDSSDLKGLYSSQEERSKARAAEVGGALARLAKMKASAVDAEPYSPPAAGGAADSVMIYVELR